MNIYYVEFSRKETKWIGSKGFLDRDAAKVWGEKIALMDYVGKVEVRIDIIDLDDSVVMELVEKMKL